MFFECFLLFLSFIYIYIYSILKEKLEKAIAKLKENEVYFDNFIDRMHRWLVDSNRLPIAMELFRRMDMEGEGAVTHEEFKAGNIFSPII